MGKGAEENLKFQKNIDSYNTEVRVEPEFCKIIPSD